MPAIKFPPLTVEDAVDYLQANMPPHYETQLTTTGKDDLSDLHYSLGAFASNVLGLWSGNDDLMESCRLASGNKDLDADDASMLIITRLWEKLNNQDNLGFAGDETFDEKEPVSVDEMLMSEVIQSEALANLLDRKGIISKKELREEMKRIKASMPNADRWRLNL
ncbi:MAG: hypothetical protein HY742_06980 [Deltaproteobacteria bacterium]|nr:hypothetical protein [Deltaproteobacteria bacterium]